MIKFNNWLVSGVALKIRLTIYIVLLYILITKAIYLLNLDLTKSSDTNLRVYAKLKWRLLTTWFNLDNLLRGDASLRIRLTVYIVVLTHLILKAGYLLNIDYSSSSDPNLQLYVKLKWRLMTAWFNLLTGPYLVMSIFCEWNELQGKGQSRNVVLVNKVRHFLFSSILLPVTTFADIMFWRLYNKDRRILMPLSADEFISVWDHHSMHTVSLFFVFIDLVSVPRKRPRDMTPHIAALMGFLTLYFFVCLYSIQRGEYIYPILKALSTTKLLILLTYIVISNLFYYTGQWFITDIIWGQRSKTVKTA